MTTLVLKTAGSLIGGAFLGPFGAAIGGAIGASAGYAIDQTLFGSDRSVEGPRLSDLQVQTSTEGAPIARLYGRARINGQVFWATHFVEKVSTREQSSGGSKGGSGGRVEETTYSYFANFAVGLCEGEIAYVGRVWANGTLLDLENISYRVHLGTEEQLPDTLMEAKQGADNTPAYRGMAYIVFEELPLADFGNRIPQLTFEVVRPVGELESQINSIVMIPGSTEFGYDTLEITRKNAEGEWQSENRHSFEPGTDFSVSVDHLLAQCPNLKRVALVVTWFGSDLRAGHCTIEPRVDQIIKQTDGDEWTVAGISRSEAMAVSQVEGRPAYGGTPSDASVKRAILDLKARGLEVVLYPFIMMDIAADNELPDPYGGDTQASYPWRGRITCHPAPGSSDTADKTAEASHQIDSFYSDNEWNYRRFIHHYAALSQDVGGVETFLIGSELRGLSTLRDEKGAYPFVYHLKTLALDVREIVGPSCKITYGADWSEYFGHQPSDEAGYVRFHLDSLWADPNIDAVGIDNYMPMADWRSGDQHLDASLSDNGMDVSYLQSNIAGGEGFDWYYASSHDREQQIRTPITDGAAGKPWVFRYKDLISWWSNEHHDRDQGVEFEQPTEWLPKSKPIWFTELGCAAVHMGANQPNVFPDPKSSENALPYFSAGARDDAIQRAMLTACLSYWQQGNLDTNPHSPVFDGPMVDPDRMFLWAWDARPFPAFPLSLDSWSDGDNWLKGHWLNGRIGGAPLDGIFKSIMIDYGLPAPQTQPVSPILDGFVLDRRMSVRLALEGLCDAFGVSMIVSGDQVVFKPIANRSSDELIVENLVDEEEQPLVTRQIEAWETEVSSMTFGFKEIFFDYRQSVARYDQPAASARQDTSNSLAVISTQPVMTDAAKNWLRNANFSRHTAQFSIPPSMAHLEVGDHVVLTEEKQTRKYRIDEIEDGVSREVTASLSAPRNPVPISKLVPMIGPKTNVPATLRPVIKIMDLPLLPGKDSHPHAPYVAVYCKPWLGEFALYSGNSEEGFAYRQSLDMPAVIGVLKTGLPEGTTNHWNKHDYVDVELLNGTLTSVSKLKLLSGANTAAIKSQNGNWEIIQFQLAELIGARQWRLKCLLRGQLGTEVEAAIGAVQGADFVLIDEAVQPLHVQRSQIKKELPHRLIAAGAGLNDKNNLDMSIAINGRGLQPLSPTHLRVKRQSESGALDLSWLRRGRVDADSWVGASIPLSEEAELYSVKLNHGESGQLYREFQCSDRACSYTRDQQTADGLDSDAAVIVEICQLSNAVGKGRPLVRMIKLDTLKVTEIPN